MRATVRRLANDMWGELSRIEMFGYALIGLITVTMVVVLWKSVFSQLLGL